MMILPEAFANLVQIAEIQAAATVTSVASALLQLDGARQIGWNAATRLVEHAQVVASLRVSPLARPPEKLGGTHRVPCHAPLLVEHHGQARTSVDMAPLTSSLVQRGRASEIAPRSSSFLVGLRKHGAGLAHAGHAPALVASHVVR
jgi:hypothetical protein